MKGKRIRIRRVVIRGDVRLGGICKDDQTVPLEAEQDLEVLFDKKLKMKEDVDKFINGMTSLLEMQRNLEAEQKKTIALLQERLELLQQFQTTTVETIDSILNSIKDLDLNYLELLERMKIVEGEHKLLANSFDVKGSDPILDKITEQTLTLEADSVGEVDISHGDLEKEDEQAEPAPNKITEFGEKVIEDVEKALDELEQAKGEEMPTIEDRESVEEPSEQLDSDETS